MKKHYVPGTAAQAESRPRKAGHVTKPICEALGDVDKNTTGMGSRPADTKRLRVDSPHPATGPDPVWPAEQAESLIRKPSPETTSLPIKHSTATRIQELEELLNLPDGEGVAELLLGDIVRDLKTGALDVLANWDWEDPETTRASLLTLLNRWRREDDPKAPLLVVGKLLGMTKEELYA